MPINTALGARPTALSARPTAPPGYADPIRPPQPAPMPGTRGGSVVSGRPTFNNPMMSAPTSGMQAAPPTDPDEYTNVGRGIGAGNWELLPFASGAGSRMGRARAVQSMMQGRGPAF